jgi:hypothetical protein
MITERSRESRIRRLLAKDGFVFKKTPARSWHWANFGPGYTVVDDRNTVVSGATHHAYSDTLEDVEVFVAASPQQRGWRAY